MKKVRSVMIVILATVFIVVADAAPPDTVPAPAKGVIIENTSPIGVTVNNTDPVPVEIPQPFSVNVENTPTVKAEQSGEWVVSLAASGQPDFSQRPDLRLPATGRTIGGPGYDVLGPGERLNIFVRDTIGPSSQVIEVCTTAVNLGEPLLYLAFSGENVGGSVQTSLREVLPGRTMTVCTPLADDFAFMLDCSDESGDCVAVWRVDQAFID